MKIGLIGAGAMGEAIVASVIRDGVATASDIQVTDVAVARLDYMGKTHGITVASDPAAAVKGADVVILAVKPQDADKAAASLAPHIGAETTVVSIMAGVTLARLGRALKTDRIVRAMPNTPAQIGAGMTVWTATPAVTEAARANVQRIFGAMGKEAFVADEKYIDMATAINGSGPAYVFLFIEALTDAGVHVGLAREVAAKLALQTVLGSAQYADETGRHPAELRNQVTSPGGTTAEALRVLESGSFRSDMLEAVIAAYERAKALGEESK